MVGVSRKWQQGRCVAKWKVTVLIWSTPPGYCAPLQPDGKSVWFYWALFKNSTSNQVSEDLHQWLGKCWNEIYGKWTQADTTWNLRLEVLPSGGHGWEKAASGSTIKLTHIWGFTSLSSCWYASKFLRCLSKEANLFLILILYLIWMVTLHVHLIQL